MLQPFSPQAALLLQHAKTAALCALETEVWSTPSLNLRHLVPMPTPAGFSAKAFSGAKGKFLRLHDTLALDRATLNEA